MSRRRRDRVPKAGQRRAKLPASRGHEVEPFTKWTGGFGAAGLVTVVLGFVLLSQGSIVLAPVLLALGFLVLFPVALVR